MAQPLREENVPELLALLQSALSSDPGVQKQAEAVLASLQERTGYCSCLAAIVGSKDADHSARWLAAVQLKNSVNKHWRPRYNTGGLCGEEKAYLRGTLLSLVPQEDHQIAVQVAVLIAKAARFDFPQAWPGLFNNLLAGLDAGQAQQQQQPGSSGGGAQQQQQQLLARRTYLVLHHVLKELSSKRLAADQRAFAEVAALLFDHVLSSWGSLLNELLGQLPAALAAGPGQQPPPALLLAFERWLLLLKILRRLLLFGFPSDAKTLAPVPAVVLVAPQLLAAIGALQRARPAGGTGGGPAGGRLAAMVERGMLKLLKTLRQVQEEHPWSFHASGALLPALDMCVAQLAGAAGGGPWPAARELLLVAAAAFVLGVLRCDAYAGRPGGDGGQQAASLQSMAGEVAGQLAAWWAAPTPPPQLPALGLALAQQAQPAPQSRAVSLLQLLVAGFLPLHGGDLEAWAAEGEDWAHGGDDSGGAAGRLRPTVRQLAHSLLLQHKAALLPALVALLAGVSDLVPPGWGYGPSAPPPPPPPHHHHQQQQQQQLGQPLLPGPCVPLPGGGGGCVPALLLLQEAVYEAAGLTAYELAGAVDFPGWLAGRLLPEMAAFAQQQPQQQPAGRRLPPLMPRAAARLVGQWVAELAPGDRHAVFAGLTGLLVQPGAGAAGPDVVLQLAAVGSLRTLVDDFGFEAAQLGGLLPALLGGLSGMLTRSTELDTQTQVFGLLNLLIDRLGPDVAPHVPSLLPLLPGIWEAAEQQSLLRIQVLCCLSLLVNVLGPDSPAVYPLLLPLLRASLDPSSGQPELLEDALALWLVALRNAPGGPGDSGGGGALLELTPALTALLAASTEHIVVGMQLVSSLLLLGGGAYLAAYGQQLLAALAAYVGEVVERGLLLLLPPLDLLLVAAPEQAAATMLPAMQRLLALLLSGRESALLVSNALLLFGRLALQHPAAFEQLLGGAAAAGVTVAPEVAALAAPPAGPGQQQQQMQAVLPGPEGLLLGLVGLWCESFDSIAQPLARKLAACGLAALLALPVKALLAQLPLLLPHVVSAWLELEASGADDPASERGELLYGGGLWSSSGGGGGGWCEAGGVGDADGLVSASLVASEEAAGEAARRQALRDAEPLRRLRISSLLADKLHAAAALHGPDLNAAMAALDPEVGRQVAAVLAAAGHPPPPPQQQQQ